MFGLVPEYQGDVVEPLLSSASEVNIIIGMSGGLRGNIVIGLDRIPALKVVSAMMGGMEISALDSMTKSALSELVNMLVGSALGKLSALTPTEISPPTLVTGYGVLLLISRLQSHRLIFDLGPAQLGIAYCLE